MNVPTFGSLQAMLLASLLLAGAYLYSKLYYLRITQNAHIPQLPSSLLWGHLLLFDKFTKQGVVDRHPDAIFSEMHERIGKPPIMLLDNWPIVPPMVIVANHEVAEQISRPTSIFPYSNEKWKDVRKRFNPGFAPHHLMTLLPVILQKAQTYLKILDHFADEGRSFSLDQHTTNLTFDIIGAVTMGEEMNAQQLDPRQQGELVGMFKELIKTFADDKLQLPWWLIPRIYLKRRRLGRLIANKLKTIVQSNFQRVREEFNATPSRSILALSLQDMQALTPEILAETCDQLKTFLFAGHDSTSSLICWAIYELSRTPHALQAVRDELDEIFGRETTRDPTAICQKLLAQGGDELIRKMTYISAVLKECLRLYPPAGSVRVLNPGTGLVVKTSQGDYNLDGNWIYINHYIIHRDQDVYGDTANDFVPERWLTGDSLPPSVWRPFERGPRNCIGQELANIEARAIIALLAHRYTFEKVGLGELDLDKAGQPVMNDKGQFATKSKLYLTIQITGKPVDGMMLKVRRTSP
ncbi:hypothetical protein QQS21_011073 [Conoideocrella luteorostrata]|uniref:Cytochrome P450 n=1 Tax=Conoideocrella luteorostrata TaxID=1105319 RepID=A0AAJ0CIA4_9HYPO|nr:hypothetical protein QQS21_011073 [Conoideocrella luteorostrata]